MRHLDLFSGIGGFALATEMVFEDVEHIFCEIMKGKNGADLNQLLRFVETSTAATYTTNSNNVAVHIKGIRQKIRENGFPFEIETVKGSRHLPGRYKINVLV